MKIKDKNVFNILNIADIHFGKKNDQKLYQDLKNNFIEEIPNIIKKYGHLNLLVIEGDLFERVIKMTEISSNYVLKFVTELCELATEFNFYFRVIQGTKSHDNNQLNNFNHLEIKYPLFKIIRTVNSEILTHSVDEGEYEYSILYLPEESPENYKEHYKLYFNHEEHYDCIFGHGLIDFVAFNGDDEEIKRKIKRNEAVHSVKFLDSMSNYFVIFGHIHDKQNYLNKGKIQYVGSFERFSFKDQKEKGFLLTRIDPETDETESCFYENKNASKYHILDLSKFEFKNTKEKLRFIKEEKEKCDYLKVIIPNKEENKDLLKEVMDSDVKIESDTKLPDDVIDKRFEFLIKKTLPFDESVSKFIDITTGNKVKKETINKLLIKTESM